jgi:putative protein kinase ArgK-like GTPase of G3E family
VPVLLTEAVANKGIDDLVTQIAAHGATRRAARTAESEARDRVTEWAEILRDELSQRLDRALKGESLTAIESALRNGNVDPYGAALEVLDDRERLLALLGGAGLGR